MRRCVCMQLAQRWRQRVVDGVRAAGVVVPGATITPSTEPMMRSRSPCAWRKARV